MQVGLVGAPSSGKSTTFKALTLAEVETAAYPFTTIEPNKGFGHVRVPCAETAFDTKCNPKHGYCVSGTRFVPVELLDVAGLVPGAHEGKGLGNKFLDDLRQADALIHVIDASGSTNEKGEAVEAGSHDPLRNVDFLEQEIDLWFLSVLRKGWTKLAREAQVSGTKVEESLAKQLSGLDVKEEHVKKAIRTLDLDPAKPADWSEDKLMAFAKHLRQQTKPIVIAANKMDLPTAKENIKRLQEKHKLVVPCSAEAELTLKLAAKHELIDYMPGEKSFEIKGQLNDKQKEGLDKVKELLDSYGSTGIQQALDTAVFKLLEYIAIFPGGVGKLEDSDGNRLPDCFLMAPGTTALDFAFFLHTDFGKNFIRAVDVRTKRTIGKDHPLKHEDVIEIISGK